VGKKNSDGKSAQNVEKKPFLFEITIFFPESVCFVNNEFFYSTLLFLLLRIFLINFLIEKIFFCLQRVVIQ